MLSLMIGIAVLADISTAQTQYCPKVCTNVLNDAELGTIPPNTQCVVNYTSAASGKGDEDDCTTCEACSVGFDFAFASYDCAHTLEIHRPAGYTNIGCGPYNRPGLLRTLCNGSPDYSAFFIYPTGSTSWVYFRLIELYCPCEN